MITSSTSKPDRQLVWIDGTAFEVITRADGTVTYSRKGR